MSDLAKKGEEIAVRYLQERGYKILGRNFKTGFSVGHRTAGEIDIISKNKEAIVFVEVKTITENEFFAPEDKIDAEKKERLIKTAKKFLIENGYSLEVSWQIDVIGIRFVEDKKCKLRHTPHAVTENDLQSPSK